MGSLVYVGLFSEPSPDPRRGVRREASVVLANATESKGNVRRVSGGCARRCGGRVRGRV